MSKSISGDEARALALGGPLDYAAIGFLCGLEIHQQLDTRKLFSPMPSGVIDPDEVAKRSVARYDRRLRATQSELGDVDAAAIAEAKRRRSFRYLAIDGLTSLVETDEEPPHPMSEDAMEVALQYAGLLGSRPADEVHVMRKTVIDGSNTSGFQRTALVATGGSVDPEGGPEVAIWTLALEEDSARKLDDKGAVTTYTLDRLGVPLIEVATGPQCKDPKHAQATAARLGALLRATGKVRRGLGSIRQDLNVSVAVGDRVEIKGCQDLRAVPRVIEGEARRQLWLHHIKEQLLARGFSEASIGAPTDVSSAFADTEAKMVARALSQKSKVLALPLQHWSGLIQGASKDGPRMGIEFAAHAKIAAGVKGVFHSDELPAYGISSNEVEAVRASLQLGPQDGFVLCVERRAIAEKALLAVADRALAAIGNPPKEVRVAQPDDSTRFMRPLPGAARMYPETDVPPIRLTREHWADILGNLPAKPEERALILTQEHGLSENLATQLVREDTDGTLVTLVHDGVEAGLAARVLTQILPECKDPARILTLLPAVAHALAAGRFAKEAVPDVIMALDADPTHTLDAAIEATGSAAADDDEVTAIIDSVIASRLDFVRERGMASMGPLMGPVMAELRGKADGAVLSAKLKQAIQKALG